MSETSTPGSPFANSPVVASAAPIVGGLGILGDKNTYYKVLEVRRGGMGEVYICELVTKQGEKAVRCALKTFQRRLFFDRATRQAFLREVIVWARVTGEPHIMPLLGLVKLDHRPFVRMIEVPRGQHGETTVRDLLREGALPPELVLRIAIQTALGMRYACERVPGLIHGDMKPENLLLMGGNVFVSDFGLARAAIAAGDDSVLESTWAYRAPELWQEELPTAAADIYAFGIMLIELLMGRLPFHATSRAEWKCAHCQSAPISATESNKEGLSSALALLASRCLAKNPADRPESFAILLGELASIGSRHDMLTAFTTMLESQQQREWLQEARRGLRPALIRTLSELDEHNLALEELDAIPSEEYDVELWLLRGRTLSLSGRDEEALRCFEHALAGDPEASLRIACHSEYALSLKRLRRFSEAVRVYKELLRTAPDDEVPGIVINFATVHIQDKQPREAVALLTPFVRKQPDFPEAWGNLGIAQRLLGKFDEAAYCFRRAMALAPDDAGHQVLYAELCMDDLHQIEEAAALLDNAYDQGYMSRNWLVRFLACNMMLGREGVIRSLVAVAQRDLSAEEFETVQSDTTACITRIVEAATSSKGAAAAESDRTPAEHARSPNSKAVIAEAGLTSEPNVSNTKEEHDFSMPFVNYRLYDFQSFSLDFYYPTDAADFIAIFQRTFREATREIATSAVNCELRPTLFFFTQCPNCKLLIMTNRSHGKKLTCRACDTTHASTPMERADLTNLLERVEESVERNQASLIRPVHVLLIQTLDFDKGRMAEQVCAASGFSRVPEDSALAGHMCMTGRERSMLMRGRPFSVWQKEFPSGPPAALEGTPQEVEDLVRALRSSCGDVASVSMSYDADDDSPSTLLLMGRLDELEEYHRRAVREQPDDLAALLALIQLLIHLKKIDEAFAKARAAVVLDCNDAQTWKALGQIECRREQWGDAVDALSRAVALDPVDPTTLVMLAHSYEKLGDRENATQFAARARTLGGNPMLES